MQRCIKYRSIQGVEFFQFLGATRQAPKLSIWTALLDQVLMLQTPLVQVHEGAAHNIRGGLDDVADVHLAGMPAGARYGDGRRCYMGEIEHYGDWGIQGARME